MDSDPTKRPAWVSAYPFRARTCNAILLQQCGTLALYFPPHYDTYVGETPKLLILLGASRGALDCGRVRDRVILVASA